MDCTDDSSRHSEFQKITLQADRYRILNGRYPAKIRVGRAVASRAFPKGATTAVTLDFHVEMDDSLDPEEVVMD